MPRRGGTPDIPGDTPNLPGGPSYARPQWWQSAAAQSFLRSRPDLGPEDDELPEWQTGVTPLMERQPHRSWVPSYARGTDDPGAALIGPPAPRPSFLDLLRFAYSPEGRAAVMGESATRGVVGAGALGEWMSDRMRRPRSPAGGIFAVPDTLPAYQYGTRRHPGGAALVGEEGPELVDLPEGSSVLPLDRGAPEIGGDVPGYDFDDFETDDGLSDPALQLLREGYERQRMGAGMDEAPRFRAPNLQPIRPQGFWQGAAQLLGENPISFEGDLSQGGGALQALLGLGSVAANARINRASRELDPQRAANEMERSRAEFENQAELQRQRLDIQRRNRDATTRAPRTVTIPKADGSGTIEVPENSPAYREYLARTSGYRAPEKARAPASTTSTTNARLRAALDENRHRYGPMIAGVVARLRSPDTIRLQVPELTGELERLVRQHATADSTARSTLGERTGPAESRVPDGRIRVKEYDRKLPMVGAGRLVARFNAATDEAGLQRAVAAWRANQGAANDSAVYEAAARARKRVRGQ